MPENEPVRIMVPGFQCRRCGHKWVPLDKDSSPKVCPSCKSPYWDRPRRDEPKEATG